MKASEIRVMTEIEDAHWWYQGLRDLLSRMIDKFFKPNGNARVLDAGCGTGATLVLLKRTLNPEWLGGFDTSDLALEYCQQKLPDGNLFQHDIRQPIDMGHEMDLIVSCDVLSEAGLTESREGMQGLADTLSSGGLMILHLPAYQWLRSQHDLAVQTNERCTRSQVRSYMKSLGLTPVFISYRLCCLFPVILPLRLRSAWFPTKDVATAQSDLRMPNPIINHTLVRNLRTENQFLAKGGRFPFGLSIIACATKP
ncbi:class I SAM-dependent methyltransferase [Rubripirellula sp.]|nr:class I SAM-dependent methyltransferase [Rubripirellula sp.]